MTPTGRHRAGRDADTAHLSADPPARESFGLHHIEDPLRNDRLRDAEETRQQSWYQW